MLCTVSHIWGWPVHAARHISKSWSELGARKAVWHVCCVYHVQQERDGRATKKKREREKIGSERSGVRGWRGRGGIWEQKHRKNNRKGKLRDQA